jgi:hypothetical protein
MPVEKTQRCHLLIQSVDRTNEESMPLFSTGRVNQADEKKTNWTKLDSSARFLFSLFSQFMSVSAPDFLKLNVFVRFREISIVVVQLNNEAMNKMKIHTVFKSQGIEPLPDLQDLSEIEKIILFYILHLCDHQLQKWCPLLL